MTHYTKTEYGIAHALDRTQYKDALYVADFVAEHSAEKGNENVGEPVDRVEELKLGTGKVEVLFEGFRLSGCHIIEIVVAEVEVEDAD